MRRCGAIRRASEDGPQSAISHGRGRIGALDTSSEFISSAGDEFDIVVDYVTALRTDPVALQLLGSINRRAAFGYSAAGYRLRGLLRLKMGNGLFDFSLLGGVGLGYMHPGGNDIGYSKTEKAPLAGAGLEIDFHSESDVVLDGYKCRHEEPNYRLYQFAGTAHLRDIDVVEFGLPIRRRPIQPSGRRSFARSSWPPTNGATASSRHPRSGSAPRTMQTSAATPKGNALVTHVGRKLVNTAGVPVAGSGRWREPIHPTRPGLQ